MDSLQDILQKKADDIDLEANKSDLELAQAELDRHFEGRITVDRITKGGVLLTKLQSSEMASELRFTQTQIIEAVNKSAKQQISAIRSRIK